MAAIVTAYELACGLAHLHSLDIVHGDLSGFNVMLSSAGEHAADAGRGFSVRVGDFGLARDLGVLSKVETRTYGECGWRAGCVGDGWGDDRRRVTGACICKGMHFQQEVSPG